MASSGKSGCVFPRGVAIDICISYAHFRKGRTLIYYEKSKANLLGWFFLCSSSRKRTLVSLWLPLFLLDCFHFTIAQFESLSVSDSCFCYYYLPWTKGTVLNTTYSCVDEEYRWLMPLKSNLLWIECTCIYYASLKLYSGPVNCVEITDWTLQTKIKIKSSRILQQKQDNESMKCLWNINLSKLIFLKLTIYVCFPPPRPPTPISTCWN